jgi:hypothetical protein
VGSTPGNGSKTFDVLIFGLSLKSQPQHRWSWFQPSVISIFWNFLLLFGFEVPASISLVLGLTPTDTKLYFGDYFPSDSKFERVGCGFDSHANLFCRLSSRPPTVKSSSKFQQSVPGSTPISGIFLFSNTQSRSLSFAIPGVVLRSLSWVQLSLTALFAGFNVSNDQQVLLLKMCGRGGGRNNVRGGFGHG